MVSDRESFDAVVCGAGVAGIASAYALSKTGVGRIALIDYGPPLSLTSDKSTECYRNWWPGPGDAMVALMNRSITLMEEHARAAGDPFQLTRRGYLFATARSEMIEVFAKQALEAQELGAGPLRRITAPAAYEPAAASGFESDLDGADLITDQALIRQHFPYLNDTTIAVLHARRCGSLSAQQLGMYLLEAGRENGVELIAAELVGAEMAAGKIAGVHVRSEAGERLLASQTLVLSPGPYLNAVLARLGVSLPVVVEKHVKISVPDHLGAVPREAPLIIWTDPVHLEWSEEEREVFAADDDTRYLVEEFPAGVHGRPVGSGNQVLMYWTYDCPTSEHPQFPLTWDPHLPEITLRGMARLVPGLRAYFDPMPKPFVDGGYYTKTPENRPLIGPLPLPGAFVCSAFSGFGIMASCAAGELLAAHVTGGELPHYAPAFLPSRYDDPDYQKLLATWDASGQL